MSGAKRPPLPVMMVASDLLDGHVVFLTDAGWSRDPHEAWVAHDEAGAQALERAGTHCPNLVVDPHLVDVEIDPQGRPIPRHFRERIRLLGPSHLHDAAGRGVPRDAPAPDAPRA